MERRYRYLSSILIILTFVLLMGCQSNSTSDDNKVADGLIIYTSIYPIQFLAEKIAGDTAHVTSIYPPGVDAHTYEPTSREVTEIAKSDAFIYLGVGMEGFSETVAESLSSQDIVLLEIGQHKQLFSPADNNSHHEDNHSDVDPHIWLDPLRMIEIGQLIKDELSDISPEHEEQFNENFKQLADDLTSLDNLYIETLSSKKNKEIIVSHAAYGYWEDRYDIVQIPISGLTSTDEPSQKQLAEIANLAKESKLHYVIFDQTGEHRLSTIIQEYIGAEKLIIHNLEVLTENDIKHAEDYMTLMEENLNVLDKATH